jgi:hypothetical protein
MAVVVSMSLTLSLHPAQAEFGSIVDIGIGGDLYFTNESANNGQGFVNLLIQNTWSSSQLWLDVGAGGLVGDTATSYVKVPQFYYRLQDDTGNHITLGRARYDWSFADEFWNMGLTQPVFKWNQARPETQGLTGLFVHLPLVEKTFEVTLFASKLFVPTQGPSFELTDGQLTSSNPWFNEPVQVVNLAGEPADLSFDVDVPRTQDVVLQDSFGFLVGSPQVKKGWLFKAFYLNKPRNDLVLPFEGALNLTTFNGDIRVLPQVAQHEVMGVDFGWNFINSKTVVSWVYEADIRYDIPQGTTFPTLPDQNVVSLTQLFRLNNRHKLWFGYINVERTPTQVGGVFANSPISTYLNRNRFEEAAQIKWDGIVYRTPSNQQISASLAYTHSLQRDNIWISSDIRWVLSKGLEVFNQCDFFGGSEDTIVAADFLGTFQNNDRCFVGGQYAF